MSNKDIYQQVWLDVWDKATNSNIQPHTADQVYKKFYKQTRDQVYTQIWNRIGDQIWDRVGRLIKEKMNEKH